MGNLLVKQIVVPYLKCERTIRIYLPNSYEESNNQRYPVLYMHDGQNVFEDGPHAFGGRSWQVRRTLEQREASGASPDVIVVGVDNDGARRFEDYSPWKNDFEIETLKKGTHGGDGDAYADFMVRTLKPYIDHEFRTMPDAQNTAVAGSSMGGLISLYLATRYPEVYGKAGIFSIASWFCKQAFECYMTSVALPPYARYFLQVGTNETSDPKNAQMPQIYVDCTLDCAKALLLSGLPPQNLFLGVAVGEEHNELCWANHMESFFRFLFEA